jgi:hypothetical protein
VLENRSGEDWEDVELTVVSGHPVTFRQALYDAYFVERPEVPVEVLGRILPRPDEGASPVRPEADGSWRAGRGRRRPCRVLRRAMAEGRNGGRGPSRGIGRAALPPWRPRSPRRPRPRSRFRIPHPVSAPAGHSLMVPIISREVPAERVSLYQPDTHPRHPLASLR